MKTICISKKHQDKIKEMANLFKIDKYGVQWHDDVLTEKQLEKQKNEVYLIDDKYFMLGGKYDYC